MEHADRELDIRCPHFPPALLRLRDSICGEYAYLESDLCCPHNPPAALKSFLVRFGRNEREFPRAASGAYRSCALLT
jgi:hypothetical protein